MNDTRLHQSPIRRKPRIGSLLVASALLALAAPAVAHVVEATLQPFLSRYSNTAEETITDFTTFKLVGTFIYVR